MPTTVAVPKTWRLMLAALAQAFVIILFDLSDGSLYLGDVDDALRALQIRELLRSGAWYDRTLPMISMPEAYVLPWSRLVDLPYAAIATGFSPFIGPEASLKAASLVWPPIMLVGYCALVVSIVKEMLPKGQALEMPALLATILAMALSIWEFSPGRIDHHNVQLLATLAVFWGVMRWTRAGALASALAIVVSVAVGLELLPLVAIILCAVCGSWIIDRPAAAAFYRVFGLVIAVGAPTIAFLLVGPVGMTATECDAFSAPYVLALFGYGLISVAAVTLLSRAGWKGRALALVLGGGTLLAFLIAGFPLCRAGPYHMVDALSRTLWLNRFRQEHSILMFFQDGYFSHLLMIAALMVILLLALPLVIKEWRAGRTGSSIVYLVALASILLTLMQTRYIRFPTAFVPLLLPLALLSLRVMPGTGFRIFAFAVAVLSALGVGLKLAIPVQPQVPDIVDYMSFGDCTEPDLSDLALLPAGRIMAPMSLGISMAAGLPAGMSVAGISFHRSSPGIRRILQVFLSDDPMIRRSALAPFDYMAVCRFALPDNIEDKTLFATLLHGREWPGLVNVTRDPKSKLRIYRIDHASLR